MNATARVFDSEGPFGTNVGVERNEGDVGTRYREVETLVVGLGVLRCSNFGEGDGFLDRGADLDPANLKVGDVFLERCSELDYCVDLVLDVVDLVDSQFIGCCDRSEVPCELITASLCLIDELK